LPTDERGHQRAWRMIFSRRGGTGSGLTSIGFLGKKGEKGGASSRDLLR
jgi:hypothetical protein